MDLSLEFSWDQYEEFLVSNSAVLPLHLLAAPSLIHLCTTLEPLPQNLELLSLQRSLLSITTGKWSFSFILGKPTYRRQCPPSFP